MDFATPIVDMFSRVMGCGAKHINYLRALEKNLNQLKEKMVELNAVNIDIKNKVNVAESRLMKRTNKVDEWMQRVEARRLEVDQIILEGTQHLETRCLNGCFTKNCWSGYKVGKMIVKKLAIVEKLMLDGVFEVVAENLPLPVTQELPETSHVVGLDSVFDRAWNVIGENSVRIMGLYGMGGVGKTTLLKRINNEFSKRGSDFDVVIWVVISKEVNMAHVQEEIGEKLGLSLPDTNDIFNVLKTKKFMLLLDDIWQRIDLQSIGIPLPSFQNKSKIVFTTRSEVVCGRMEADKIIRVECLNWEAAWTLFQEKVGNTALRSDSDIPRLAEVVAKECVGLPLALITIGRSMASKKTRHEWEHAISVLKNSAAEFPGMGDDVLPLLKFSYDSLPNDSARFCFLFCSLYPKDYSIPIPELIEKWLGEKYIIGYENFKEAYNIGHDIIGMLKGACLLEEGTPGNKYNDTDSVKMHDVIRDLALWIACDCGRVKDKFFVRAGVGLIEAPRVGKWPTMAEKISLIGNKITQLKPIPKCPNLSSLLLSENVELKHIDNDFFLSMPALRFLDLSYTAITEVPLSICKLVELEFLDLSNTTIKSMPCQMKTLTKLKYLFLSNCHIPSRIISSLWNLEFLKFDIIKSANSEGRFEMDELLCLKQINSIEIGIDSDRKDVEKFLSYPHFADCARKLMVSTCKDVTSLSLSASSSSSSSDLCLSHLKGLEYLRIVNCSEMKDLKLNWTDKKTIEFGGLNESLEEMEFAFLPKLICSWDAKNLHSGAHFKKLHSLFLSSCHAMVDLTWLLLVPNLQTLDIQFCDSLQEIISSDKSGVAHDKTTFSNLKTLTLFGLRNLQSICSMSALPFPSLQYIHVIFCPKLRRLPLDSNSANNSLKEIQGDQGWWDRLEWDNETIKLHFTKFYVKL